MRKFLLLGLIAIVLIAGCTSETEYGTGQAIAGEPTEKIEILDHKMEYGEYGSLMVTGTAKNVGDKQLSYAEIRVRFYDKDDSLLSTSFDNINDLDAGQTWKFKVLYFSMDVEEVDHYDIGVGTVW